HGRQRGIARRQVQAGLSTPLSVLREDVVELEAARVRPAASEAALIGSRNLGPDLADALEVHVVPAERIEERSLLSQLRRISRTTGSVGSPGSHAGIARVGDRWNLLAFAPKDLLRGEELVVTHDTSRVPLSDAEKALEEEHIFLDPRQLRRPRVGNPLAERLHA